MSPTKRDLIRWILCWNYLTAKYWLENEVNSLYSGFRWDNMHIWWYLIVRWCLSLGAWYIVYRYFTCLRITNTRQKRKYIFLILLGGIACICAWGCCCRPILLFTNILRKLCLELQAWVMLCSEYTTHVYTYLLVRSELFRLSKIPGTQFFFFFFKCWIETLKGEKCADLYWHL